MKYDILIVPAHCGIFVKGERCMFKVNPKVYASMFSLPTEIVDKGLKFANCEQIKVILCVFRNNLNWSNMGGGVEVGNALYFVVC